MVNELVDRLQHADGLIAKLGIAGLTLLPVDGNAIEQSCRTCMYYAQHRRFCELPELMLPVGAQWSCRMWRI